MKELQAELDRINALAGKATPGPWAWNRDNARNRNTQNAFTITSPHLDGAEYIRPMKVCGGMCALDEDASFIANAHETVALANALMKRLVEAEARGFMEAADLLSDCGPEPVWKKAATLYAEAINKESGK
ncbi:MAG: hypothetical protein WC736_15090 [Gallionella sp.]